MTIDPIPTAYKGIEYRSRLEARWALFLDIAGYYQWQYEPRGYGTAPDFKIGNLTLEVKGQMPNTRYLNYLRHIKVDYVGIGGFFEYRTPKLMQIQRQGVLPVDFFTIFPYRVYFNRACEHRFDL